MPRPSRPSGLMTLDDLRRVYARGPEDAEFGRVLRAARWYAARDERLRKQAAARSRKRRKGNGR